MKLPRPGLQGDYRETCVACLRGTDTGFATEGEAEFHIAALMTTTGVPTGIASEVVRSVTGAAPGKVLDGEYVLYHQLCGECAEKTGTRVGLIGHGLEVPAYRQSVMFPSPPHS